MATAAGQTWTVSEVVDLVAADPDIAADPLVLRSLAELWIDYTLLATSAVGDSTLSRVDMSEAVEWQAGELAVDALQEREIRVNLDPEEARSRFADEAPDSRRRVQQILLAWPEGASDAQRDSVRREAERLRAAIVSGDEDFSEVARVRSADAGSAARGGEIGWVRRGQLLPAVDQAVYALDDGAVSAPVETPYGVHLVRVVASGTPSFEQFRTELTIRMQARAESLYIAGLEEYYQPEVVDPAPDFIRAVAGDLRAPRDGEDLDRTLVRYQGGRVTPREVVAYIRALNAPGRNQIARSVDDDVPEATLRAVVQRELLITEAARQGIRPNPNEEVTMAQAARRNLANVAREMGLSPIVVGEGEDRQEAVHRTVSALMDRLMTGEQRQVTPLGAMAYVLRDQYPHRVFDAGVQEAVSALQAARARTDPAV